MVEYNFILLGFLFGVDGVDWFIDDVIMILYVVLKVDLVNVYLIY